MQTIPMISSKNVHRTNLIDLLAKCIKLSPRHAIHYQSKPTHEPANQPIIPPFPSQSKTPTEPANCQILYPFLTPKNQPSTSLPHPSPIMHHYDSFPTSPGD